MIARSRLPSDFDPALWLDPLSFQGLIGSVIARSDIEYRSLFRADGFAKKLADLQADPKIARIIAEQTA